MSSLDAEALLLVQSNDHLVSYALALAIGWSDDAANYNNPVTHDPDVQIVAPAKWAVGAAAKPEVQVWFDGAWRAFDFNNEQVIDAISERFGVFPVCTQAAEGAVWTCQVGDHDKTRSRVTSHFFGKSHQDECKARALCCAMAVITAHQQGLLSEPTPKPGSSVSPLKEVAMRKFTPPGPSSPHHNAALSTAAKLLDELNSIGKVPVSGFRTRADQDRIEKASQAARAAGQVPSVHRATRRL
jgi:hypothetical protein